MLAGATHLLERSDLFLDTAQSTGISEHIKLQTKLLIVHRRFKALLCLSCSPFCPAFSDLLPIFGHNVTEARGAIAVEAKAFVEKGAYALDVPIEVATSKHVEHTVPLCHHSLNSLLCVGMLHTDHLREINEDRLDCASITEINLETLICAVLVKLPLFAFVVRVLVFTVFLAVV